MSYQYNEVSDHVKNFRPQCLVLSGSPEDHKDLVHLVSHVTKNNGMMACAEVTTDTFSSRKSKHDKTTIWLRENKVKAFHCICTGKSLQLTVCIDILYLFSFPSAKALSSSAQTFKIFNPKKHKKFAVILGLFTCADVVESLGY